MITARKLLIALTFISSLSFIFSMTYDAKDINLNTLITDKSQGSQMKFYTVKLDTQLKDNDLVIDARMSDKNMLNESPIVLVSLKPLPNTDKNSQWVCGQLGLEACFVPNKYLSDIPKIYIGVICENCNFNLKTSYIKEEPLFNGENKLFHLKAGDRKVFILDDHFHNESKWISINSFNLRQSNYKMNVEIVEKANLKNLIEVPIQKNWIGGKVAKITPNLSHNFRSLYFYRIILTATEDSVLNVEARTSNSLIKLNDKSLKFESVKKDEKICFNYKINDDQIEDSAIIETKSIKGDIKFWIFPAEKENQKLELSVSSQKELKHELTSTYRNQKKAKGGDWVICSTSENHAFFTIQVYMNHQSEMIREYKKLLYQLVKTEKMYDVGSSSNKNVAILKNMPVFRTLLDSGLNNATSSMNVTNNSTLLVTNNITTVNKANNVYGSNEIHINGSGVAGIGITILFLIPVLIGSYALMSIFVNTKFLDQPLRIKIMD